MKMASSSSSQNPIDPTDSPSKHASALPYYGPPTEYDNNLALARRNRELCLTRIEIHTARFITLTDLLAEQSWWEFLPDVFKSSFGFRLSNDVEQHMRTVKDFVHPPLHLIFNAFNTTPFYSIKAVILGQEPYTGTGQAMGLSFSVPEGIAIPPILVNIFKELHSDLGIPVPSHGNLEKWALQGVFLLNSILTVKTIGRPHPDIYENWERFTDSIIRLISLRKEGVVFVLWGNSARQKASLIDKTHHHCILEAAHPLDVSEERGFFGCKHFSQINQHLEAIGIGPIDWQL